MRPTGHILDLAGEHERLTNRPMASMPALTGVMPPDGVIDWRPLADIVLDQMRSQACVWHAVAMALYLRGQREKQLGLNDGIPMPSTMQPWILAQWQKQTDLGVEPTMRAAGNFGTSVSAGLKALHGFGIVAASTWPLDDRLDWSAPEPPQNVTFDMPLDVDVSAAVAKLTGDYGASGADWPIVADAALVQGYFPVLAFDVCDEFFALRPGADEYKGTEGRPVRGRHMMVCDGRRPGWKRFRGSWGKGWGTDGWIWVSDDYCASVQARDGAVITAAPKGIR